MLCCRALIKVPLELQNMKGYEQIMDISNILAYERLLSFPSTIQPDLAPIERKIRVKEYSLVIDSV